MTFKKGFGNFGTTIATIGSILIAVGIAWLLADNWHYIPKALKIIILLGLTFGAYFAGVEFKIRKYQKIGSTLIFLGSALFTLSVFLIAQIFSLPTTLQMNATLILISMIGVFLASYLLNSSSSLLLGLVEVFFFITIQFMAITEQNDYSGAYFAIIYLLLGMLIYGLTLIHRKINNGFSKIYIMFSILYFLFFAYILTFESLLPNLWLYGFTLKAKGISFLITLGILSIASLAYGIKNEYKTSKREIIFFSSVIIALGVIILSSFFILKDVGSCSARYCYDVKEQPLCDDSNLGRECVWKDNFCQEKSCYTFDTESSCVNQTVNGKDCLWDRYSCVEDDCYFYRTEGSCFNASVRFNNTCKWETTMSGEGYCGKVFDKSLEPIYNQNEEKCQIISEKHVCQSDASCKWGPYNSYYGRFGGDRREPLNVLLFWIFTNIVFLGLIIFFILYATLKKDQTLINIGIAFFSLDIFTRYIGFIVDYAGYLSLSIFFITGGIILVFGGYMIEKWRRNLIKSAKRGRR